MQQRWERTASKRHTSDEVAGLLLESRSTLGASSLAPESPSAGACSGALPSACAPSGTLLSC